MTQRAPPERRPPPQVEAESEIDPRVLDRILLLQGLLQVSTDLRHLAEVCTSGLMFVPGAAMVAILRGSSFVTAHDSEGPIEESEWVRRNRDLDSLQFPMKTWDGSHGMLHVALSDTERFARYQPYVQNTANLAALIQDNWRKALALEDVNRNLEEKVRQRTASLGESEERFRTLVEHAADPLFLIRPEDRRFLEVNQQACDAFGYDRDELLNLRLSDLDPAFPFEEKLEPLVASIEPGKPATVESVGKRKDGSTFPVEVRLGVLQVAGKLHLLAMVRDNTEREHAIEEKAQLELRYRHAQKMESIGRLAGGVAHDFNNLLTVINGCAECADAELRDGDPLKADLQSIMEAGHRAAMLTRQLLAFSRKQVLQPSCLDLNEVVDELKDMLRRLLGEGVELSTNLRAHVGHVRADHGQIDQVLMNLVVNARDAMPTGGRLTITTTNVDLNDSEASQLGDMVSGPYVMLSVHDDGTGMTSEVKERVFEPFFTTKEVDQGTGLGLSTAYGIVRQSGGNIAVHSEPGQGSTFDVYLPRVDTERTEPRNSGTTTAAVGNETLLLVEDDAMVRGLTERILTAAGFVVIVASNGGDALLECERRGSDIQLLLTDVVMPKMSGRELAERLRQTCPDLKVLYMSGHAGDVLVHHDVRDGAADFISKPFNAGALLKKVRASLDDG